MSLTYDDYEDDLVFVRASLEYYPFSNFGLGVDYGFRNIDIEYETESKKETYDIELPGPIFFLTSLF